MSVLQTEFEFELPRGYVDRDGTCHTEGVMRLATAADEILPQKDPRVQSNPAYLSVILLSRVITRLGSVDDVTPPVVEGLFVTDLAYLQDLYERINSRGADSVDAHCPECGEAFELLLGSDVSSRMPVGHDPDPEASSTATTDGGSRRDTGEPVRGNPNPSE
jgi:hypothetical protein